jgi:LuxR family maltose regulon positive regulatory protein
MLIWLENPAITQARVLVAIGTEESLLEAIELLRALEQATEALNNRCQTIEILALQSLALEKQGQSDEALSVLGQALALAEPRGWIRPFVEPGPPMVALLQRFSNRNGETTYLRRLIAASGDERRPDTRGVETAASTNQASFGTAGRPLDFLTNREHEVLELLARRLQNKEIAAELFISTQTVNSHLKSIYQKLDVKNRRQAAVRAVELGLLPQD